jgi:hypothetical protein
VTETYAPTRRADKVADWIEIECLRQARAMGSDALIKNGRSVGFREADVSVGLTTMRRRLALLGAAYPFRVANGAAAAPWAANTAWTALLLMSRESPIRPHLDLAIAANHLERVTADALCQLYGSGTYSVRFAWPSDEGRPPEFPEAIRWLADRMKVRVGSSYRPPYNKDGGVDVVAWRPFPDGRSGFPVLLAQCTLERDYARKAADVDTRVWAGWLALDVDPSTALSIPDVVGAGEDWNALAARTVVLDRLRLATLLRDRTDTPQRMAQVVAWANDTLSLLRERT